MPERLMGTDCKFVGNMSTLVQIQLGPIICQSTMKLYNPLTARASTQEQEEYISVFIENSWSTSFRSTLPPGEVESPLPPWKRDVLNH